MHSDSSRTQISPVFLKFVAAVAFTFVIAFFTSATFGHAQEASDGVAPEAATTQATQFANQAKASGKVVTGKEWMVSAANPLAVEAGAKILKAGGTAADAMVAVQAVLGLVEPQSSGLGGGAFLVWFDAASGKITTLDGRETAPMAVTPTLFQDANGKPLKFFDAVVGGRSVGTPGTPKLLDVAQAKFGKLVWSGLFDDAITLAEGGFTVSPRLAQLVAKDRERLSKNAATRDYFITGNTMVAGSRVRNLPYGNALRMFAANRSNPFYTGEIANKIVSAVTQDPNNPGVLAPSDLANYTAKEREAVCATYRGHDVCGMGPPSSGALTVGQILKLVEPFDLAGFGPQNPESWRLIGDASRLAFADRGRYMADSDFVPVPGKGLLRDKYIAKRSALLKPIAGADPKKLEQVSAGEPEFDHALLYADDESLELPSTSHISIVDRFGNALSMTTTIENGFGSRLMANGFLLNNELTDFSFRSHKNGVPIANRVEPGKRPRSSMAPTIVLKDGRPVLVIGSPGGSRIIGYVAQAIIAHLDWGMDVQQASSMGHAVNRFGTFDLEVDTPTVALEPALAAMGYKIKLRSLNSGIHAISIGPQGQLSGGADPRREGIAIGQ